MQPNDRQKLNMKRVLESLGIHQRDLAPGEEVQLSLEQAFYLHTDLKALEIYLPSGTVVEAEVTPQVTTTTGAAEGQTNASQATPPPFPLSTLECWKAYVGEAFALFSFCESSCADPFLSFLSSPMRRFRTASATFVQSAGSYRYFREQG
jgi:hypothetical protein